MMIRAQLKITLKNDYSPLDLETIINCTKWKIDLTSNALLRKTQLTSAAVERLASMLSNLLRKDRNFDVKNVNKDMMLYYHEISL